MRAFIGILIPDYLKEKILAIQNQIREMPIEAKMVEKDNLHITLSFLGEVDESEIESISQNLDHIARGYKKFEAKINGIKLIKNRDYLRVICLDVISQELNDIIRDIKQKIGGDAKQAHLTLCRVKRVFEKDKTINSLLKLGLNENLLVESINLIKSVLRKSGPEYFLIHKSNLL